MKLEKKKMEESVYKQKKNNHLDGLRTVTVPFSLEKIQEIISITTNTSIKLSKEEIINLAFSFHAQGNISGSIEYYQYFIDQGFNDHRVFSNYGLILRSLGKLKEAEQLTRRAIEFKPDFANAYSNLGNILLDLGKLEEAEIFQSKSIELKPSFAQAYSNLGNIQRDLGKLEEAEISINRAINLKPNLREAYFNLSYIQLLKGDYESGLINYEYRNKASNIHGSPNIQQYNNSKFSKRDNLLIISEQGLGDTLQQMRYIPYLRKIGLNISFCAQEKLHSLIKQSGIDPNPIAPNEVSKISEGQWIPMLSLLRYLKVNPNNPIISRPYIFPNAELIKKWKDLLKQKRKSIIGINWQGNPQSENGSQKGRSFPLETFSTIAKNKNIKLVSLQKGFGSEQLEKCSFKNKFVMCQSEIDSTWDFLENAAIIAACDLIITSDTSIAHLAGGIGKPTWLLLKNVPEWRWGTNSDKSFWYPSMKLFRQSERNNWNEVMDRVSIELQKEVGEGI